MLYADRSRYIQSNHFLSHHIDNKIRELSVLSLHVIVAGPRSRRGHAVRRALSGAVILPLSTERRVSQWPRTIVNAIAAGDVIIFTNITCHFASGRSFSSSIWVGIFAGSLLRYVTRGIFSALVGFVIFWSWLHW